MYHCFYLRWFFHGRSVHLKRNFVFCCRFLIPLRWNSVHLSHWVEFFSITMRWEIMYKDAAVPGPIQWSRATVKTFTTLIK